MQLKAAFAVAVGAFCLAAIAHAESYRYDATVTVNGVISKKAMRLPGDKKATPLHFLRLANPISVACAPNENDCQPEGKVTDLQLNLDAKQVSQVASLKDPQITLRGSLFHTDTWRANPYHFTSVLMNVEAINP